MYDAGFEAFLAIVRTENLKRAADALNLSQATVSYRLKILEQEMGNVLMERGKGVQKIALTSFGENFVAIAERWDALRRETEMLQAGGARLTLAIGGSNSLNTYVLPPLYQALVQYRPRIRLQFRTQHSVELWDALERRDVDVAFVKMERTVPNIVVEPFFVDESVLIRPASFEPGGLPPIHPTDLAAAEEIYFNWGPAFETWHDHWWNPLRPEYIPVDTAGLIFSLLQDPRQWSVVPKSVADTFVKSGRFISQRLLDPPPVRTCYKITHKKARPATQQGLAILERHLAALFPNNAK